jgi:hypothetical protein
MFTAQFDADGDGRYDSIDRQGRIHLRPFGQSPAPAWSVLARPGSEASLNAGDLNGDGYLDAVVADVRRNDGAGVVYAYLGPFREGETPLSATLAPRETATSRCGASMTFGDFNGDGFGDVVVNCPFSGNDRGRAYVFRGSSTGPSSEADVVLDSPGGEGTRFRALTAKDIDGDGFDDLLVGARAMSTRAVIGDAMSPVITGWIGVHAGSSSGLAASPEWYTRAPSPDFFFLGGSGCIVDLDGTGRAVIAGSGESRGDLGCAEIFERPTGSQGLGTWNSRFAVCDPQEPRIDVDDDRLVAVDVTGDARDDICYVRQSTPDGSARAECLLGGATLLSGEWRAISRPLQVNATVQTADVDGDGIGDLVLQSLDEVTAPASVLLGSVDGPAATPIPLAR